MSDTELSALETPQSRKFAIDAFAMIALLALVAMLYWPATQFQFLNWDDPWYVLNNELIKNWSFGNLKQIATEPVARNYAPITIFSFLVDHTLWGEKANGYHAINVILHLLNGFLVYKLIVKLADNRLVAWGTAAFFIAHPLQVETVAWISSRKGLLSAAFMLLALLCWLPKKNTGKQEFAGLLFLIAALLCKAIAIMVPPIVVVWQVLVNRRRISEAIVRQFVPVVLSVLLLLYTMSAQTTIVGGIRSHIGFSKIKLLAVDAVILWKYFGMLLWPSEQCVLYDPPTEGISIQVALSLMGLIALSFVAWRLKDRIPKAVSALAVFALLLLPVMNLFPITTLMNDRYLYLPSIPFFAVVVSSVLMAFRWGAKQIRLPQEGFAHCVAAICILCAVTGYGRQTAGYLPVWKDSLSLWSYATEKTPTLAVTWIQLALTHHSMGNTDKAIQSLETAMFTCPLDKHDEKRVRRMLDEWSVVDSTPTDSLNARNARRVLRDDGIEAAYGDLIRLRQSLRISGSLSRN